MLYSAFDLYPSTKGAATHIRYFAEAGFDHFNGGILHVIGNEILPRYQKEGNIHIHRFRSKEANYLKRAEYFTLSLRQLIDQQKQLPLIHFRDIWSGLAALKEDRSYKTLFEVNSLPSIELPYHYKLSKQTIAKIVQLEQYCLTHADHIVVPSKVIQSHLIQQKNINPNNISCITNGAIIPPPFAKPADAPAKYLIYFGAVQAWQGIDDLLKAFAGLQDFQDLKLVICCSNKKRYTKPYLRIAKRLGIEDRIIWLHQLPKEALFAWLQHALLSIAPLKEDQRNSQQGCSPIKIFESMACSTPIVASNLAVTREILTDGVQAKLVRPERPAELSVSIRFLLEQENLRKELAVNAFDLLQKNYQWEQKQKELKEVYSGLIR